MPRGLGGAWEGWGHPVDQTGTQSPVKLCSGENAKARLPGEAGDGAKGTVQGPQALNHILHPTRGQPPRVDVSCQDLWAPSRTTAATFPARGPPRRPHRDAEDPPPGRLCPQ